jgi:hypothetical protein
MRKRIELYPRSAYGFLKAALLLWMCCFSLFGYSQQVANKLIAATEYYKQEANKTSKNEAFSNAKNVQNLLTQPTSAIYVSGNSIKTYGKQPKTIILNLSDISQLGAAEILPNQIELIQFNTSPTEVLTSSTLDVQQFARFKNLKYLHFTLQNEQEVPQLRAYLANENHLYTLLYSINPTDKD